MILSLQNITAGYQDNNVLHDVTIDVEQGRFIGIIGPNGSGKSTLLKVISAALPPRKGTVVFGGTKLKKIKRRQLAQKMACLSQDITIDLSFTVRQVTLMGRSPHLPRLSAESRKDIQIAEEAMQMADVAHLADKLITQISSGERQRALIAMCLAQQPQLLLLDEPTSHLDIGHQLAILNLLKKLNRNSSVTIIAVLHELNLASEYCDKLLLLNDGRVEIFDNCQQVITDDLIKRVYKTKVLTGQNPISGKPHIILTADEN